ncbi:Unknown protein sequence [Pseudomonas syringae pv. maculicola]|nr:Unknown protein sequence [Pseudomonas syringae pv. maculicola]
MRSKKRYSIPGFQFSAADCCKHRSGKVPQQPMRCTSSAFFSNDGDYVGNT